MSSCPCGSGKDLAICCGPILAGAPAATPEALMRSRYTAFTQANLDHLENTLAPEAREDYDRGETETWVKEAIWQGLDVRSSSVAADDAQGSVEFVARYKFRGKPFAHHELASFRRHDGNWVYVDGMMNPKPAQRQVAKVGRNDPCPCDSGKKFKQCCGR